jgi:ATP synthase protein I
MSAVLDKNKKLYTKVFVIELALIIIIYVLLGLLQSVSSLSFLLGALIACLPQVFFVIYVFYWHAAARVEDKLKVLYQGEIIKISLTIVLLLLVFININLNPILFFAGYFCLILLNNLLPFVLRIDPMQKSRN